MKSVVLRLKVMYLVLKQRNLRSGRTLLTFKITDYTSSIMVKMFSRDKEDAAHFDSCEKRNVVKGAR